MKQRKARAGLGFITAFTPVRDARYAEACLEALYGASGHLVKAQKDLEQALESFRRAIESGELFRQ